MSGEYEKSADNNVEHVIANARRLIDDARLILKGGGSHGTALALAILAFEEIGKGHGLEMHATKTKYTPSWHQFRQSLAATLMILSLFQKYGIATPEFSEAAQSLSKKHRGRHKSLSEMAAAPIPEDYRREISAALEGKLPPLTTLEWARFDVERRWVSKVMMEAYRGDLEKLRQQAIYVDFNDDAVSTPESISALEAERWILVAERALVLLETGDFELPYSPLAEHLEKTGADPLELLEKLKKQLGEIAEGETPDTP